MADVQLKSITKTYGKNTVVDNVSLDVEDGRLLTLLGPSGCGKTTTLRMVAGFVRPTRGAVYIGGSDITAVPPHRRDTGMVFQQYALFPHMTVWQNVEFGLRMRRVDPAERRKRAHEVLEIVDLAHARDSFPRQLSGGQQQRVALARVLAIRPKVILFDEPLSNLDAKLRLEMRLEVRHIQQEVGITSIFVTHDQEEAIMISDSIAVMNKGVICQVGAPAEVFNKPQTPFVADFVGTSNLFEGRLVELGTKGEPAVFESLKGLRVRLASLPRFKKGDAVLVGIRPEKIHLGGSGAGDAGDNLFRGKVIERTWMGSVTQYSIALAPGGDRLIVVQQDLDNSRLLVPGEETSVSWSSANCLCFKR